MSHELEGSTPPSTAYSACDKGVAVDRRHARTALAAGVVARPPGVAGVLRGAGHGALSAAPDDAVLGALGAGEDAAVLVPAPRRRRVGAVLDAYVRIAQAPAARLALAAHAVEGVSHEVANLAPGHPAEGVRRRSVAGALDKGADGEAGDGALRRDGLRGRPRVDHGGRRRGRDLDDDRGVAVSGHHVVRRHARVGRLHRPAIGIGGGGSRVGLDRAVVQGDGRLVARGAARVGVARVDDVRRARVGLDRAAVARGGPRVGGLGEVGALVDRVEYAVVVAVGIRAAVAVRVVLRGGAVAGAAVVVILHAVAVAVTRGAAGARGVSLVGGACGDCRALVAVVDHAVAVVVLPVGKDRGRRRDRRDDDRSRAAGPVGVGLDAVADRHAGADVVVVEDAVAVSVDRGAAGSRRIGRGARRNRRALVGVVGLAVVVLVAAAAREGAAGDENEGERVELGERRLVHGLCLLRHVRSVARHCWRVVPASCRRGFLGTNARPEKREDFRPSAVKLVWVGSKEQRLLSDSEAKSSEILVPKSDLRQQ